MKNKGGGTVIGEVVMLILTMLVFSILFLFVAKASTGHLVYEEAYAKKVALLIDNARPDLSFKFYAADALAVAKKNKISNLDEVIKINQEDGKVLVDLSGFGGYEYRYFSNYKVNLTREGEFFKLTFSNEK